MSKFARRKDLSHAPIVADLEAAGIVVFDTSSIASLGFDLVCYNPRSQKWGVVEIKTLAESKARDGARAYDRSNRPVTAHASSLTNAESKAGRRAPIPIAATSEDALKLFR